MEPALECSAHRAAPAGRARAWQRLRPALRCAAIAGVLLAAHRIAGAEEAVAPTTPTTCSEAAVQAERAWNLPAGLLGAIGRAESGRLDPLTGRLRPWPFTINVAGSGYFFGSAAAAVAYVQALQNGGVRSIDVGCFQINLLHHPAAFASIAAAFDAGANAAAAGQFLSELHQRSGDWAAAVARYHSGLAERGEPYRARVFAAWQDGGAPARLVRAAAAEPPGRDPPGQDPPGRDPHVVLIAASASRVALMTPGGIGIVTASLPHQSSRLPRVFVPD